MNEFIWRSVSLGEVLPFKYGKNLPALKRTHSGEYNVVSSAGIVDTHCEAVTSGPAVVIGRKGTVGSLTYCKEPAWPTDTAFYTLGTDDCDVRFGYYLLQLLPLSHMNNDSAVPGLNRNDAESLIVQLPPVSVQQDIVSVLGALDDKIAANSYAMKSALQIISVTALKIDTVTPVKSIARRNSNSLDPQKIDHQQVLHYSIPAFDSGYVDYEMSGNIKSSKFCISSPCVLVSKLNPRTPRVWSIPRLDTVHYSLASTEFVVLEPVGCSQGQLYAALSQPSLFSDLRCLASGTSNSHQRIKPSDLLDALVPDVRTLSSGDIALVDGLSQLMDQLDRENQTLAHTRDELLPLLMSGKISVREAEEAVLEVGVEKREGEDNVQ